MLGKVLEAVDCDGGTEGGRSEGERSGFDRALGICCRVFRLIGAVIRAMSPGRKALELSP
jgi:hypothetical protein